MKKKAPGFGTRAVSAGEGRDEPFHPSSSPIYQSSTFFFPDTREFQDVSEGKHEGFIYTRLGNPTVDAFEQKVADLEGAESGVAFSSGMAAVSAVFLALLRPGDEVVSSSRIYGGSRSLFENTLRGLNCTVRFFDPEGDLRQTLPSLLNAKTRLIFFETPSNPELSIVDIRLLAAIGRKHRVFTVIDNTFATPYLQRPLSLGIDCVLHSATKYFGGHGDAIGGVVAGPKDFCALLRRTSLLNIGGCLSPFNAWLFLRGMKTLHLRMDRHCDTAARIADFLQDQKPVGSVCYPGLRSHPGHRIAKKQMDAFGGVVSFRLRSRAACRKFLDSLRLCRIGVSLGDAETLALSYAPMFHPRRSDAQCRKIGIDPLLVRISTGLEDADDIIRDIRDALRQV
ncbi:MAG: PLP-dependent aspartate aminotransferase family protein [Thermodesulfovibrionales bacterium]